MSILLVNYEYPPIGGGAANATYHLARAFAELGEQPVALTAGLRHKVGETEEEGVIVHRLPSKRADASKSNIMEMLDFMRAAVLRSKGVCRRHGVSKTIAFFTIPSGPVSLYLRQTMGLPYVVSLRGGDVPGHVPGLDAMHAVTKPLRRAVLRRSRAIVAPSPSLAAASAKADPFPAQVIPSGVDTGRFFPADPPSSPFIFLFVGRLHPEKNLPFLLERLAAVRKRCARPFELHLVGDGAQRQELEALGESLGLASLLKWRGWVDKAAVPALYRRAHCLTLPSQYEGLSNTALEAMASGLPVAASDVPGNAGLVRHGETGLLLPLDDPAAWEQSLEQLIMRPETARAMGLAAREEAEANYSWSSAALAYLELF